MAGGSGLRQAAEAARLLEKVFLTFLCKGAKLKGSPLGYPCCQVVKATVPSTWRTAGEARPSSLRVSSPHTTLALAAGLLVPLPPLRPR